MYLRCTAVYLIRQRPNLKNHHDLNNSRIVRILYTFRYVQNRKLTHFFHSFNLQKNKISFKLKIILLSLIIFQKIKVRQKK